MKTVTTVAVLPPAIIQSFNQSLLCYPCCEDRITLWEIFQYIKENLYRKSAKIPERQKKCQQLEKQFLDLYERIKNKEKQLKEQTEGPISRPFYHFKDPVRGGKRILTRLRVKRHLIWKHKIDTTDL